MAGIDSPVRERTGAKPKSRAEVFKTPAVLCSPRPRLRVKAICVIRLGRRRSRGKVRQRNPVHGFPIIGGDHLNGVPRAAIQKSAVRALADAFLAADAEVRIDLDAPEWRVIFVGHPEHTRFNWTILDAGRRTGTPGAAVGSYRKDARSLLACCLAITL